VDVGGFAEPRKILCQCVYPPLSKYQYTPGPRMGVPEFPNTFGFRRCFTSTSPYMCVCMVLFENKKGFLSFIHMLQFV